MAKAGESGERKPFCPSYQWIDAIFTPNDSKHIIFNLSFKQQKQTVNFISYLKMKSYA